MHRHLIILTACAVVLSCCPAARAQQDKGQTSAADRIARAAKKINQKQTYQLAYNLKKGDELRFNVEHVVSTKFRMAGEVEESSSRSETTKLWKVANTDSLGNITFVYSIEAINMWQKVGEADPVSYNSKTDKEIPDEYKGVAQNVGKSLAVFFISPNGNVLDRQSNLRGDKFGAGKVTIPLPEEPVPVGFQWNVPTILEANDEHGQNKKLKSRILYTLEKVKGQNAFISFRTEILTPVTSEKIKSTLMQQMTKGHVVFDMKRGRPILKRVDWDEKAQGFEGPDSYLKYTGRMSERLVENRGSTAPTKSALAPIKKDVATKPVEIKTREGQSIMRK